MGEKIYSLKILPLFEDDLNSIVDYLCVSLQNQDAAIKFIEQVEEAILKRLAFPESFEVYQTNRERKFPYYRIYVGRYIVYYVVIDSVMEVRRILYNKREITKETNL